MNSILPTSGSPPLGVTSPGRPWIRTTYQFAGSIQCDAESIDSKWSGAVQLALDWAKKKVPGRLPDDAARGAGFLLAWPGQKLECVAIPSRGIWTLRLEHPDTPYKGRPAVAGRTWTTDVAVSRRDGRLEFGTRIFCASLPYVREDTALTRPWVVVGLAQSVGLSDVRPLSNTPWVVQTEADVERFRAFLFDPDRRLPVVVLTQPDRRRHTFPVSDFVLDGPELAKKLLGVAHVVQLTWEMAYQWTRNVGKLWSVFLGAVRTYMPGFDPDRDSPTDHPLETVEKIVFWKNANDQHLGEGPFTQFLSDKLGQFAASRGMNWGTLAFAAEARTAQAEVARLEAKDGADWRQLYEDEIAGLKVEVSELKGEIQEYCQLADQADKERDQYQEANRQLRSQVNYLRQVLSERTGGKSESEIPIADNYEEVTDWVNRHLTGRLELHSRAHRGLKDADYEDVALVFRCLLLLANEYRNQCLGHDGAKDAFEKKLGEYGLRISRSISPERAGEQGDEYFVRYPTAASPKRFLEWHLRKGSNKDTRYCLGIYFFWDADTEQVIVGWLPSHLDNRMT